MLCLLLEVAEGLLQDEGLARALGVLCEHVELDRLAGAHVGHLEVARKMDKKSNSNPNITVVSFAYLKLRSLVRNLGFEFLSFIDLEEEGLRQASVEAFTAHNLDAAVSGGGGGRRVSVGGGGGGGGSRDARRRRPTALGEAGVGQDLAIGQWGGTAWNKKKSRIKYVQYV